MIPQASVQEDQTGNFVLVVDPDDKIERRPITTGRPYGGSLVVTEGLQPDERVVVEGIQKVRPGMKVAPKEAPLPGSEDLKPAENEKPKEAGEPAAAEKEKAEN
jgi:membrane fusion protein (multidrug efflux system)